jgi:hypothetical protein
MVDRGTFTDFMNDLSFVDERVRSHAPIDSNSPLPEHWVPDSWSVICGRGKECFEHFGNRRFRILVELNNEKYIKATSKLAKSLIVISILDAVREGSQTGGFVKQNPKTKRWFEVGDAVAREKIGQQFRLASMTRSKKGQEGSTKDAKSKPRRMVVPRRVSDRSFSFMGPSVVYAMPQTEDNPVPMINSQLVSDRSASETPSLEDAAPKTSYKLCPIPSEYHKREPPALIEDLDKIQDFDLESDESDFLWVNARKA